MDISSLEPLGWVVGRRLSALSAQIGYIVPLGAIRGSGLPGVIAGKNKPVKQKAKGSFLFDSLVDMGHY